MQVRCPHCSQVFSTTASGDQPCPSCGASIHVPDASETGGPGAGLGAGPNRPAPVREPTPWERRGELGRVQGWFRTLTASTLKPQYFWPSVEPRGAFFPALLWAWIGIAIMGILSVPIFLMQWGEMQRAMVEASAQTGPNPFLDILQSMGAGSVGVGGVLFMVLLYPVFSLIVIAVTHVSAMIVGAAKQPFETTARAYYYAQGPQLLNWIPMLGFVAGIYSWVLFGWGIKELHGTTGGRAAAAVLLPMLVLCLCVCGVLIFGAAAIASAMQGADFR